MNRTPVFIALTTGLLAWFACGSQPDSGSVAAANEPDATSKITRTVRLDVGLTDDEAALWHHHDEGSGFLPLSFFHALEDAETSQPFIETLSRFGFVPDPNNEFGLPIGLSAAPLAGAPTESILVGVSCAACHSGQYTYGDTAMTIDGAPNMLDFEGLLQAVNASLVATLESPKRTFVFLDAIMEWEKRLAPTSRWMAIHPEAHELMGRVAAAPDDHPLARARVDLEAGFHAAFQAESPQEGLAHLEAAGAKIRSGPHRDHRDDSAWARLQEALPKLGHDLEFIRRRAERLLTLQQAFSNETTGGPGRADSFDSIWDLLIQDQALSAMDAPVSIPHLFEFATFEWVHWDGNSSDVMGRDYAQAIALGADYVRETGATSVLPHNIIALEKTARKIRSPAWPSDILGPIDVAQADRGEQLFALHCGSCHSRETLTPAEEVGTDPGRANNFAALEQNGKSYRQHLIDFGATVARESMAAHGVTAENRAPVERSDTPTWRVTHSYIARPLDGIWASPPYLHNGSVPSLWHLLLPTDARPEQFQVGRELDPRTVGIDPDGQGHGAWVFNVREAGNANTGHEYGIDLPDDEKWALVEYLKTL